MKMLIIHNAMKLLKLSGILLIAFAFTYCSEEKNTSVESGGSAPGMIKDIKVTPISGGAEITYLLPEDENLLYVEAEVNTPEGRQLNFKSSSYSSNVTIMGLATEKEQEVSLYSVSKSGVRSEATSIKIHPLAPPYIAVFNGMEIIEAFGGVKMKYKNETGADLAYLLGYIDDDGTFVDFDGYYSKSTVDTVHTYRGLESVERKFGVYIRDRWDNFSDTLFATLTPLFEEEIDKSRFQDFRRDNDGPFYEPGDGNYWNIQTKYLWDGAWSKSFDNPYMEGTPTGYINFQFNSGNRIDPLSLTFDMGALHYVNRIRVNHYWRYYFTGARKWEVWGCSETPPADGSWEWPGWIKLADMEQIKPSGLPISDGNYGEGDAENWLNGTNAEVEVETPVRYIRIRSLLDWNGGSNFSTTEITLYGQEAE